ncbi:MAG: glycosyltransferase family 2 protein [Candidatus Aenigmarchaeota archaeon]|nr:glycosyltransferase family 2 protein [Candidatus Aenigmarchaeota archaeon]
MTKTPSVSVVVCTRNRNEYLGKCLDSLLHQTLPPKEIIIVDDYSTQANVSEFFKKEFSISLKKLFNFKTKIILVRNKKQSGVVMSRNSGIKIASGNIIAFLDDDGFANKDWIENLVKNYSNVRIVGVGGPVIEIGRNVKTPNKPVKRLSYIKNGQILHNYRVKKFEDIRYLPKQHVRFLMGGNMSFRRDVLLRVKGGDVNFTGNCYREETDLCFKVINDGKLIFEPSAVTYHNTADKGGMRDIIKFQLDNFLYYMHRNTTYFFFKHFNFKKAFDATLKAISRQIKLLSQNKTGIARDYLEIHDRHKSMLSTIKGTLSGIYCWFNTRTRQVELTITPINYIPCPERLRRTLGSA